MKLNNICFLFRCSIPLLQKYNYRLRIMSKERTCKIIRDGICRYFCSSEKINKFETPDSLDTDTFKNDDLMSDPYEIIDVSKIIGNDAKKIKDLELIKLELYMMHQNGEKVPRTLSTEDWKTMLSLTTKNARIQFLQHLWLKETKKINYKQKKKMKQAEYLQQKLTELSERTRVNQDTNSPIKYSLCKNTLFQRIYDTRINRYYNYNLLKAMMFGLPLLLDCSYETSMTSRNVGLCLKQLLLAWSENRDHRNPYYLIFCNVIPDGKIITALRKRFPTLDEPDFPFFYTSEDYLSLYPKERLVYLTSDTHVTLNKFNSEDVYIIGALADKAQQQPLSLMKAKRQGLRSVQFPLDKYLKWVMGVKSLPINQALAIMNDIKDTNDWNYAFKHVPRRKTVSRNVIQEEPLTKVQQNLIYEKLIKFNNEQNEN